MKTALYPRLAWDGLRKNKRLFTPYLLTCICMVMMFYILSFLGSPETCALLPRGSNTTGKILNLGSFVIFVFSAIFLYYTNSFLVRRREREFGLYNVLGMNKRNLARIVTWESLITAGALARARSCARHRPLEARGAWTGQYARRRYQLPHPH